MKLKYSISEKQLSVALKAQSKRYLVVKNQEGIFPPVEYYPLRPTPKLPLKKLTAVLLDMDGTLTTTEELNLHSLEYLTGLCIEERRRHEWKGLDPIADYPWIIGTSTTKSLEYIIGKYGAERTTKSFLSAYFSSVASTLLREEDDGRKQESMLTLNAVFGADLLNRFLNAVRKVHSGALSRKKQDVQNLANRFADEVIELPTGLTRGEQIRCGLDIFYGRYHEIMLLIRAGKDAALKKLVGSSSDKHPVAPINGVLPFLLVLKGLLPDDFAICRNIFAVQGSGPVCGKLTKAKFRQLRILSSFLAMHPLKLALVTSSTRFEAEIVMEELFGQIRAEIKRWEMPAGQKRGLLQQLARPQEYFDVMVTATDSSESRLKPHRDLYSIALTKLGVTEKELDSVIGFEDSESGTMALRAAGVGLSIAVPFSTSIEQNYEAAQIVLNAGLPEALLKYNLFIA